MSSVGLSSSSLEKVMGTVRPVFQQALNFQLSGTAKVVLAAAAVTGALAFEQFSYRRKKQNLPGPKWKIPIIGAFLDSLYPTFEGYLAKWYSGPLSCVGVFDRFIVICSDGEMSRKILSTPGYAEPMIIDSMKKILEPDNWVFLSGEEHRDYRKQLNVLFTKKALSIYLPIQYSVNEKHFAEWLSHGGKAQPYQLYFRELNMESSLKTFMGEYITDEVGAKISKDYFNITAALELVNFPLALPGTKVYNAIQARKFIVNTFLSCVSLSKKRMIEGGEVTCMLDAWMKVMLVPGEEFGVKGDIRVFGDREIALTILTFLFASQDATSSALTWCFQLLADHPDVLDKVREEQLRVRNGSTQLQAPLEVVEKMTYTRQVVKEILRIRPPVLMIPYQAHKDWPTLSTDYSVQKGTMLIPTFWPALHDENVYPNPDKFDPDRWGPEGTAENFPKNYLVFGCGTHYCLGREYALMHLMNVIGGASMTMNWEHIKTDLSDKISIFATTYPSDACILKFTPRVAAQ
eukprot:TRINITY_DN1666_c0_g1_i1.p1 TRINITY_DN1666_c0_g1~~TRINITY_DN1666_c0_g1_i1.p1  ORF type:complete len:518 (-),score=174.92 TRINITY_DN1666_c0_g1_i1:210-1763(-)